jgi:excisionase family DNA binding protein
MNEHEFLNDLLSAKQVAAKFRVRPWTIYEMVKRGELPAVRVGKRILRFRPETIATWIADRETGSAGM